MLQDAAACHACTVNAYRQCIYTIYIYLRYVHILINILVRAARWQQQQQQQHEQFATNFICAKVVNKRKASDNILKYITCRQAKREREEGEEGKKRGRRESERETDTVHGRYV